MQQTDIDTLIKAMETDISSYTEKTVAAIKKAVDEEGKQLLQNVKAASPGTGTYKKGWGKKTLTDKGGRYLVAAVQKTPKKSLVHLLELGHDIKYKGKVVGHAKAFPHVTKHQTEAYKRLGEKLEKILKS